MKPLIPLDLHARSAHSQSTPELMLFGAPHGGFEPMTTAVEEAWVALDDAHRQFDRCRDRLVMCGQFPGFDNKARAGL